MSKKTARFYIPHQDDPNIKIAGDLEQVEPESSTQGRKIALVYLISGLNTSLSTHFSPLIMIVIYSGNHETGGPWNVSEFDNDIADIRTVVAFLSTELGYTVDMVVAHSRGAIVAFKWISSTPEGQRVSYFVNCAGRHRMKTRSLTNYSPTESVRLLNLGLERLAIYGPSIEQQGYYEWKVKVAGQEQIGKIFAGDIERFASWDISHIWDSFPQETHVLTLQGLADETVPPYDGILHHRALSTRNPGTHTLHMVEGANHNFIGKYDEVNETILEWFNQAKEGKLPGSGIWKTGVKTKL
ncbi:hypothetical protein Clacol_010023 [Clathrus columnatus]|uniref:Uncharacterized protein n=1 Tax=Clathrus columnatus TaxID=1419009 RepID=A0AAV5AV69_9AGAM|nr:hypothetical protein Clacol_010023 [Clathrus columnatus]